MVPAKELVAPSMKLSETEKVYYLLKVLNKLMNHVGKF